MPNEKGNPQRAVPSAPPTATSDSGSTPQAIYKLIEEAYYQYLRTLQDIEADSRRASQKSYCEYMERVQDQYRNYLKALQDAYASDQPETRPHEAYRNYSRSLQDAFQSYLKSLQDAQSPDETEKRSQDAYRSYSQTLKKALTQAELDALGSETLIAISQSIASAVLLAEIERSNWRQRWMTPAWSPAVHTYSVANIPVATMPGWGYPASNPY